MSDLNHVFLVGRLTRDAELRYTTSGTAYSKFSIAVNEDILRNEKWESEASFFEITLWGKRAEGLHPQLKKGKAFTIYGKLKQNRWEQDGKERSKIEIVATSVTPHEWQKSDKSQPGNEPAGPDLSADNFQDDIPF